MLKRFSSLLILGFITFSISLIFILIHQNNSIFNFVDGFSNINATTVTVTVFKQTTQNVVTNSSVGKTIVTFESPILLLLLIVNLSSIYITHVIYYILLLLVSVSLCPYQCLYLNAIYVSNILCV